MVTIVLLNEAWMCAMPWETCLRSFFLNVFFLPFFSGAAGPPAATGFAIVFQSLLVRRSPLALAKVAKDQRRVYVLVAVFFFAATVPLRGPFRVRALVWVRCPRTGRFRRWRYPR